jgi:outer membrane protein
MKRTTTIFFASLFLAVSLFAQKTPLVATVDVQRVLNDYTEFQTAVSQVRAAVELVESEMQNMQQELQAIVAEGRKVEMASKNPAASEEARQEAQVKLGELQGELQSKQGTLRQFQQQAQQIAQQGQKDKLAPFQEKALTVVRTMAAEQGIDLVVPTSAVIFSNPAMEITDAVIAMLNAQ